MEEQGPSPPQQVFIQPSHDAFNRWLESYAEELELLEHTLRGETLRYIDEDRAEWKKVNTPIMNEDGIQYVISYLRSNLNKNVWMSQIDEERIYLICLQTVRPLIVTLAVNEEKFEFDTAFMHTLVMGMIANSLEMSYRRAINNNEMRHVMPTEHVQTTNVRELGNSDSSQGLGQLFKFGKGR